MKGFDFAKQHLGQHNKDDVLIIHEPAPLPGPVKDHTTPSENGDVPSPKAKIPSKNVRHRGRFVLDFLCCSLSQSMFPFSVSLSRARRAAGEHFWSHDSLPGVRPRALSRSYGLMKQAICLLPSKCLGL